MCDNKDVPAVVCSVLIPAYNASLTIAETLTSVLNQIFSSPYEIIVCDDASTDDTVSVIEKVIKADPRVKLYRNYENRGVSYTRNRLLDVAEGAYIAFLDADDVFLPEKLQRSINALSGSGRSVLFHGLGYLTNKGRVSGNIGASEFLPATLIERSAIGSVRFKTGLAVGEDTDFFRQIKKPSNFVKIEDVLTAIRIRPGSLTDRDWFKKRVVEYWHSNHSAEDTVPNSIEGYLTYFKSIRFPKRSNLYRLWLGQKYGRIGAGYLFSGRHVVAALYLCASGILNPAYLLQRLANNR